MFSLVSISIWVIYLKKYGLFLIIHTHIHGRMGKWEIIAGVDWKNSLINWTVREEVGDSVKANPGFNPGCLRSWCHSEIIVLINGGIRKHLWIAVLPLIYRKCVYESNPEELWKAAKGSDMPFRIFSCFWWFSNRTSCLCYIASSLCPAWQLQTKLFVFLVSLGTAVVLSTCRFF